MKRQVFDIAEKLDGLWKGARVPLRRVASGLGLEFNISVGVRLPVGRRLLRKRILGHRAHREKGG